MVKPCKKRVERFGKITILLLFFAILLVIFSIFANFSNDFVTDAATNSAAIVVEQTSGRVLFSDNENTPLPIASTTKILTALTVIENVDNLDTKVKISKEAVGIEGSSIYLVAGEELSFRELLYGLMLRSGNDAAVALAISTSGSVDAFVTKMNETAKNCGAVSSNFTNPHGLHDDKHLCTAHDLAKITAKAFSYEAFSDIVSTKNVKISGEPLRYLQNKNKMLWNFDGADGVKTGFTKKSGRCLVTSATRGGMRLISVVLNCGDMWNESSRILNQAFSSYRLRKIVDKNDFYGVAVTGGKTPLTFVSPEKSFSYPLTDDEYERLSVDISLPDSVKSTIKGGKKVGEIQVVLDNRLLFRTDFYTISTISKKGTR